ncbi:hypothetical protein CLAFUW4_11034 [Fulvia fulva]|uniref:Uncharacterized protein n=1 Tax=Passalora fulva TaxID=5499 RepID=A0A9Q8US36_PASFU|nr:uncharacterized protein CLAFUR5_10076 [Fulvia fulva]KAK4620065.1 hypothetical protein CLAFUR4_11039 [Fulvia fulva]KAK4621121.1 hypothetical protein CLAFUR0_11045 [Fulvia fulva]UJO20351.1 hypothetical protein CLAFUR5_10076 [Fulvia fulva]WPV17103.1 hypothetical protein CLAFUW4_11034 [Fulvia fulva]WPV32091.1 hypothetical protein CLAFUW7_11031 [Fulvia fulva]
MKTFAALSGFAAIAVAAPFPTGYGLPAPSGAPYPAHGTGLPPLPSAGIPHFPINGTYGPHPTGLPFPPDGTGLPLPSGSFPDFPPNSTFGPHPTGGYHHYPIPYGTAPPQPQATGVCKREAQLGEGLSLHGAAASTSGLSGNSGLGSGSQPSVSLSTGGIAQPTGLGTGTGGFLSLSLPTGGVAAPTGHGHHDYEGHAAPTGLPGHGAPSVPAPFPTSVTGGVAQPTGLSEVNGQRRYSGKISAPWRVRKMLKRTRMKDFMCQRQDLASTNFGDAKQSNPMQSFEHPIPSLN